MARSARNWLWLLLAAVLAWLIFAPWPAWLTQLIGTKKLFVNAVFNGVTLGGLYFLVASGFTLVFGLMRNVNLAHGSLYLLGAYLGYEIADVSGSWYLGLIAGGLSMAVVGAVLQIVVFRRMEGDDLRQTLVTIGISIVLADLMLAVWTGTTYQFEPPQWLFGATQLPIV
ncbi:MAG: branched-chain amino acid ABC transporter permease, partial [Candidatus Competibacteraceae bacterium]|nr:branched-chain amino acid ABC transporter permease [Candidatus Competibacteraceae bacterium]